MLARVRQRDLRGTELDARLCIPYHLIKTLCTPVQAILPVVACCLERHTVDAELALADAVGAAPRRASEVLRSLHVVLQSRSSKSNIYEISAATGHMQLRDDATVTCHTHPHACFFADKRPQLHWPAVDRAPINHGDGHINARIQNRLKASTSP